jgi:YetA-like protein
MREALQADKSIVAFDPMREADPPRAGDDKFVARVRSGPDWLAIAGNWMTEWERTGDTKWRDKILAGMKSMEGMPHGFRTGRNMLMGFDPATGVLTARDSSLGRYNLATIMGGAELMFEMNMSIDDAAWKKVWADFCADSGAAISVGKLEAYAYFVTKNPALAQSAIDTVRGGRGRGGRSEPPESLVSMEDGTDTNGSSQNSLNAIAVLEFCADVLPTAAPPAGGVAPRAANPSPEGGGE